MLSRFWVNELVTNFRHGDGDRTGPVGLEADRSDVKGQCAMLQGPVSQEPASGRENNYHPGISLREIATARRPRFYRLDVS
ncbi:hypothetical protein ElyMa_002206500 [Elysia marginata]|uniref:Uncharacterized protein n=1 Tax=Elysia marginata TaxID=1093978 RepID=A0AAV4FRS0_9GAST|nr:hypothetical protein ElyMa_002206500 [Elysia marginata]